MFNFNKQLTALAFSTLIATSGIMPAVAAPRQTPAERLCKVRPGFNSCTVIVNAPIGVAIRSGPGSNYKKIGALPKGYDVNVTVRKSSRNWVKLDNRPGWIHSQYLYYAGD